MLIAVGGGLVDPELVVALARTLAIHHDHSGLVALEVEPTTGTASVTGAVSAGGDIEVTSASGDVTANSGGLTSTGANSDGDAHVLARAASGSVTVGSAATQGAGGSVGDVTIEGGVSASLVAAASSRDVRVSGPSASLGSGDAFRDVFVTATSEVRARRRHAELAGMGLNATIDHVLGDILARDERDSGRAAAPLVRAGDAVLLDTTAMDVAAAVAAAVAIVEAAGPRP